MNLSRKLLIAIGLLTLSGLMFELALVRLLSVIMFSNFSYLAITTALYGLALGGLVVYMLPKFFSKSKFNRLFPSTIALYALSLPAALLLLLSIDFSARSVVLLLIAFGIIAVPFTILNIALSYVFKIHIKDFSRLYFSDLLGAGLGVIAAVVLMNTMSAINVVLVSSIVALFSAAVISVSRGWFKFLSGFLSIGLALFVVTNLDDSRLDLQQTKFGTEYGVFFSKWNSFSRIAASGPVMGRVMGSTPAQYQSPDRIDVGITIDSDAFTQAMKFDGDLSSMEFMKHDHSAIAFLTAPENGNVLIIGPGGGRDVHAALQYGHQIDAVDINPIIVNDLMKGLLNEFTGGLYSRDDVNAIVADGRSFVARSDKQYDAISIPLTDTWSATAAGNLALVESNLYTVEAVEDYISHLSHNGVLSISRWSHESQRLVNIYLEAAKRSGFAVPEAHIAIVSTGPADAQSLSNILFFNQPITQPVIDKIQSHAKFGGFSIHHLPGVITDKFYTSLFDPSQRDQYIRSHPNNRSLVYDNNPFYFFNFKFSRLLDTQRHSMFDGGLLNSVVAAVVFTLITIIAPSIVARRSLVKISRSKLSLLITFLVSVGIGFMFLELPLIQKFILYLEQPVYSFSVILISILIFAGVGSYFSNRISLSRSGIVRLFALLVFVGALTSTFSTEIIRATLTQSLALKIFIATLTVAPLSLLLGTIFPTGMRLLKKHKLESLVPWAWAINGSASVLASVVAILLAIVIGFNAVIGIGLALYALAGASAYALVAK